MEKIICNHCGSDKMKYSWQQMKNGGKHLRVDCAECGRYVKFAPQIEPYISLVNQKSELA